MWGRRVLAGVLAGAGLVVAGCGGATPSTGTPGNTAANTAGNTANSAVSDSNAAVGASSGAAEPPGARDIGKTVWLNGFKVTVRKVTVEKSTATFDLVAENLGPDPATFDGNGQMSLSSGGVNQYQVSKTDTPQVPGNAAGAGTVSFAVDNKFRLEQAVLTLGRAADQQAVVPLGDTGTLIAHHPVAVGVQAKLNVTDSLDNITTTVTAAEVRADVPEKHSEAPAKKVYLRLTYDLTTVGAWTTSYLGSNFSLTLPSGLSVVTAVSPIDAVSGDNSRTGVYAYFLVDDPAQGSYTLTLKSEKQTPTSTTFVLPDTVAAAGKGR
ncbi:hypothetical protein [Actinocrispum wychmicini]|uniref:DUF4352 domain-containing protein n=1 Tax=Actinocrispum wychmicini TaxID=1213861 RepID=A0A4R2K3L7_9PSEU|nr:hypothetical protein [Actinocrispum wychmicini]TCO60905.1 hypothetical protein EV192_103487 [Actinocrispum wychmicini]